MTVAQREHRCFSPLRRERPGDLVVHAPHFLGEHVPFAAATLGTAGGQLGGDSCRGDRVLLLVGPPLGLVMAPGGKVWAPQVVRLVRGRPSGDPRSVRVLGLCLGTLEEAPNECVFD